MCYPSSGLLSVYITISNEYSSCHTAYSNYIVACLCGWIQVPLPATMAVLNYGFIRVTVFWCCNTVSDCLQRPAQSRYSTSDVTCQQRKLAKFVLGLASPTLFYLTPRTTRSFFAAQNMFVLNMPKISYYTCHLGCIWDNALVLIKYLNACKQEYRVSEKSLFFWPYPSQSKLGSNL